MRALSDDSRLAQAEAEMLRYQLQILGLSEVRMNGFGDLRTPKSLTFLYSGKESEKDTLEYGVGLLLSDDADASGLETDLEPNHLGSNKLKSPEDLYRAVLRFHQHVCRGFQRRLLPSTTLSMRP
ncbi:unnamed protein product [Arctia plantaginis]|uniref:Uncharacterized protein n=1 Tax=Arctia plantaginis TaxID=874455 RepID=A0A8S0Z3Q7_ARCPL|nr:unnamed protein product [Arctia plantaginis]CAB3256576.1 unnamed protein product [Arctia plantaginis]